MTKAEENTALQVQEMQRFALRFMSRFAVFHLKELTATRALRAWTKLLSIMFLGSALIEIQDFRICLEIHNVYWFIEDIIAFA